MVGDVPLKDTDRLLAEINAMLAADYRISHTTIQFEFAMCAPDDPSCVPFGRRAEGQGPRAEGRSMSRRSR
jgi:hypothetical protein